jgi:ADP-heptose:LPS heptosyltransferase
VRILVIRPGALGDVVLTLPALEALQAGFAGAAIEVMANPGVLQLLLGRSVVSVVSSFDRVDLAALFQPAADPAESLQHYLAPFDLILSYATPPQHVFARNLARVARGRALSFDARPGPDLGAHMSEYLQQPLRELGVALWTQPPRLQLTAEDHDGAARWWEAHDLGDGCVVAMHPGSGSPAKNWPAECFGALARYLRRERGAHVALLSGPADESAVSEVQRQLDGQNCILLHTLPLSLVAAILGRCQAYVGNDSGVSHLAAAVGVPTVAIFGPTDPDVWGPRGPSVRVVRGSAPCAPCDAEQRRSCRQRVCLETVSVDLAVEALKSGALTPSPSRKRDWERGVISSPPS